ncbi:MAG: DUF2845 domain-containing protein [Gammaproteobacteria bacterium]|nr:DUF2845 domain-containing protein [Gammaproteobacteria bacterium]
MTNKARLIGASIFVSIFLNQSAFAYALRCGTHLISGGDRDSPGKYEVLKRCGEPDFQSGNTWVYRSGGRATVLSFSSNGQLYDIQKE